MLFTDKERSRTTRMMDGERNFDFYDSIKGDIFDHYRALINSWLAEYPESGRLDIANRLRGEFAHSFEAALSELLIHAALLRLGHKVEIHPQCPHPTRRPDFLVLDQKGNRLAYVEVTSFGPHGESISSENREAALYNAVNAAVLPSDCLLGFTVRNRGKTSPSAKKLKQEVQEWALQWHSLADDTSARKIFSAGDWLFDISIHKFPNIRNFDRSVGIRRGRMRSISPEIDLHEALETKAKRYGIIDDPFLIVVTDCKRTLLFSDDVEDTLFDALFGSSVDICRQMTSLRKLFDQAENSDGHWLRKGSPRNCNVSGVLLIPKPDLWSLRNKNWQPIIARNPFTTKTLPDSILPLGGFSVSEDTFGYCWKDGEMLADILGLPTGWPSQNT